MLPFTQDEFLAVFAAYNEAVWPLQVFAYLIGLAAVALVFYRVPAADRIIAGLLALMWVWTGLAYHMAFFSAVNPAAFLFGALFAVQGIAFVAYGIRDRIHFGYAARPQGLIGLALVTYSALLYPMIGLAAGHPYPLMPMFGITPCPVTIFTFGMLLLTIGRFPWSLLAVPFLWSLIGGSAAILLAVPQDWVLLGSGVITLPLILMRDWAGARERGVWLAAYEEDPSLMGNQHRQSQIR